MNRLIEDVWNNQNLEMIPEVFTSEIEIHLGGLDFNLKGYSAIKKEYIQPTFDAFPDIKHGYDKLLIDGNMIAMSFYGKGTHKNEYEGVPATNKVLKIEEWLSLGWKETALPKSGHTLIGRLSF